jgi:hypothetical protein
VARTKRPGAFAARYAGPVTLPKESARPADPAVADFVRDPLAAPAATLAARRRPMSERLELALSWNTVASELRAGLLKTTRSTNSSQ